MSKESDAMSRFHGYTRAVMFYSAGWQNPLSSPGALLAGTKIADLLWAFQVHGWSCCIPCAASLVHKISNLRLKLVAERKMRLS